MFFFFLGKKLKNCWTVVIFALKPFKCQVQSLFQRDLMWACALPSGLAVPYHFHSFVVSLFGRMCLYGTCFHFSDWRIGVWRRSLVECLRIASFQVHITAASDSLPPGLTLWGKWRLSCAPLFLILTGVN